MAPEKTQFGRPVPWDEANLPPHLRGKRKTALLLQNATVEDHVWLGQDGELDVDRLMEELRSPQVMLRAVVLSIIDAHSDSREPRDKRLKAVIRALTGRSPERGRSQSKRYDDDLRFMAEIYLHGFFGLSDQARSLNDLANAVLARDPDYCGLDDDQKGDRRKALRERFETQLDRLLVRMTADEGELRETLAKVNRAVNALRELGIEASPRTLDDVFGPKRRVGARDEDPAPVKGNN